MQKIVVQNLTHIYNPKDPIMHTAIEDISIAIEQGEFIGLIGHTGSGKSTLVQHLNGLLKPTSGKVLIDGTDIWEKPKEIKKFRTKVGLVFQYPEYQLFEETVYRDIAFAAKNAGFSAEETAKSVEEAAAFAGIDKALFERSPFDLSGGQKRRVAIAGVMAMKPDVLVLDEPTAGLDPRGRDEILDRIKQYQQENKTTVVLVSHSMEDVAKYADRVLVMDHGKVAMFDTTEAVFSKPEQLRALGLQIPQVTRVFEILKNRGLEIDKSVFTVAYAARMIKNRLAEKEGADV